MQKNSGRSKQRLGGSIAAVRANHPPKMYLVKVPQDGSRYN